MTTYILPESSQQRNLIYKLSVCCVQLPESHNYFSDPIIWVEQWTWSCENISKQVIRFYVRCDVLTDVAMKVTALLDLMPCYLGGRVLLMPPSGYKIKLSVEAWYGYTGRGKMGLGPFKGPVFFTLFSLLPLVHTGPWSCPPSLCIHAICYFLPHSAYFFPWRLGHHIPLQHWQWFSGLHCVTSQKTVVFNSLWLLQKFTAFLSSLQTVNYWH
jgi:hypothetical protein